MAASLSPMAKAIRSLAYKHGTYKVFADFCEMAACSFSNAVDKRNYEKREAQYMAIVSKYSREEVNIFPQLLGMLADQLEGRPWDVLGELFHELELHNEHAGQFFTPYHICEMMAKMTFDKAGMTQHMEERGYITLQEPACGSGAMIISFAKAMYDQEFNFQQCLHVSAIDIDSRCVHMTYLQLTLLHIPAVVYAGNTLTMEMRDAWYTPAHIMGGWDWRLNRPSYVETSSKLPVEVAAMPEPKVPELPIVVPPKPTSMPLRKSPSKPESNQLTLF